MKITDNVSVETGYQGANVGFVTTEKGIVMIESPQKPTDAVEWRNQVEEQGSPVYLLHTEGHGDHIAGDFFFDVPIIAHEKTRDAIQRTDVKQIKDMIANIDPEGVSLIKDYKIKTPTIVFSDSLTLNMGSHTFHLINTPGHTEGQTSAYIPEEKVVFTGDNVNYQVPAFMHEAVPQSWLKSLERLGELEVDHIVPGHGEVCDKSYLDEWSSFIGEWIDAVTHAIDKGWTKEEALEKITPPSRYAMPQGIPGMAERLTGMNISRLYEVLSKGN